MDKIKNFSASSYDYLCALILVFLPFSNSIPNLFLVLLLLVYLINFQFKLQTSYPKPFLFLILLIAYLFFQALYNGTFIQDFTFYKKYLYLIILPILFYKVNRLQLLKKAALITINATILVSCFKIMQFHANFGYFPH